MLLARADVRSRVDASQGSERDVFILDCVRLGRAANEGLGFIGTERRRFCVATSLGCKRKDPA
jgi:superfamily I DNA and/or RNA helicase